jgi:membrane-associated protease RseP (regulator of RpoE activity)
MATSATSTISTPLGVLRVGLAALGFFILGPVFSGIFGAPYITSWSWVLAFSLAALMLIRGDELIEKIDGVIGDSDIKPRRLRYLHAMQSACMVIVAITSSVAVFAIIGGVSASTMFG